MEIAKKLIYEEYLDELKDALYKIINYFIYCEKIDDADDYLKLIKIPTSDGSTIEVCAAYGSIRCISADEYGDYSEDDDDDDDEPMELISISVENNEKRVFQSIPVFDEVNKEVISGVLQAIHELLED